MLELERHHVQYIEAVLARYDELLDENYGSLSDDELEELDMLNHWYESYEDFIERTSAVFDYYGIEA